MPPQTSIQGPAEDTDDDDDYDDEFIGPPLPPGYKDSDDDDDDMQEEDNVSTGFFLNKVLYKCFNVLCRSSRVTNYSFCAA